MGRIRKKYALNKSNDKLNRDLNTIIRKENRHHHDVQKASNQKDGIKARSRMEDIRAKEIVVAPNKEYIGAEATLLNYVKIEESVSKIKKSTTGEPNIHKALVSVLCNRFVIGK